MSSKPLKIGALFAGYGGLDLAVESVLDSEVVWVSEFDAGPSQILATRYPDAPNLGDVTKIDWANVEPVDIITGGSPCQDLSHAGKRAGMKAGTRSGLWASMCDAIEIIRPKLVVWENVRGALSAEAAAGDVESCDFCVGDAGDVHLRALGRVLGDLAELGYDAAWTGLRAADVGAPHGRWRVFVLAWPAADTDDREQREPAERRVWAEPGVSAGDHLTLLRTPTAQLAVNGGSQHPDKRKAGGHGPTLADEVEHLLPTPVVNDMGAGKTVDDWDAWTARLKASHGNGNGHGPSLSIEALRLLPTPKAGDADFGLPRTSGRPPEMSTHLATKIHYTDFGDYAPAIARWEQVTGRSAPPPTEPTGKNGAHRLSPRFVEWMMGLPGGWVTGESQVQWRKRIEQRRIGGADGQLPVGMRDSIARRGPSISRNAQLKALGNGVVPQQAATALRYLLSIREQTREQAA